MGSVTVGYQVFYAIKYAITVIPTEIFSKGCDASNEHDEELPEELLEFSDDEQESRLRHTKKRKRKARKNKKVPKPKIQATEENVFGNEYAVNGEPIPTIIPIPTPMPSITSIQTVETIAPVASGLPEVLQSTIFAPDNSEPKPVDTPKVNPVQVDSVAPVSVPGPENITQNVQSTSASIAQPPSVPTIIAQPPSVPTIQPSAPIPQATIPPPTVPSIQQPFASTNEIASKLSLDEMLQKAENEGRGSLVSNNMETENNFAVVGFFEPLTPLTTLPSLMEFKAPSSDVLCNKSIILSSVTKPENK